jgi:hypothetical protein
MKHIKTQRTGYWRPPPRKLRRAETRYKTAVTAYVFCGVLVVLAILILIFN